jgi:hypothetical protein
VQQAHLEFDTVEYLAVKGSFTIQNDTLCTVNEGCDCPLPIVAKQSENGRRIF